MERIAVFPGSFDPFTIGHEDVVQRALKLFDKIIIAVGYNTNKEGYFPLENRLNYIRDVFKDEKKVSVDSFTGLTVDYCVSVNSPYLLRGLRTSADFEYERAIAQVNRSLNPAVESIFILTSPENTPVKSTIVRDIIRHGGDASKLMSKKAVYRIYFEG
jgi:pantetheine-phosphate adenylyltransferase